MINNQLKNIKKDECLIGEITHLKKKTGQPNFARSRVNRVLPGFFSFQSFDLPKPV